MSVLGNDALLIVLVDLKQGRCCGAFGYEDYENHKWILPESKSSRDLVPLSCCYNETIKGCASNLQLIYKKVYQLLLLITLAASQ